MSMYGSRNFVDIIQWRVVRVSKTSNQAKRYVEVEPSAFLRLLFGTFLVWGLYQIRPQSTKKTNSQKFQVQFFHPKAQLSSYKMLKQQPFKPFQAQSQTSQPTS